jgi:hypothetical protein
VFVLIIVTKVLFFLHGMLNLDGWDGDPNLGMDAEATVRDDAAQYPRDQTKTTSYAQLIPRPARYAIS